MTSTDFKRYQNIADKILQLLSDENCNSRRDVRIICNTLMGYAFTLDVEGHYVYKGDFYNSLSELPKEALEEILHRLQKPTFV